MKKQLLLATSIFATGILCAQVANKAATTKSRIPAHLANIAVKKNAVNPDQMYTGVPFQTQAQKQVANPSSSKTVAFTETVIGNTLYDLQSNSSVGDRIVVNADGSIAACWTIEPTDGSGSYANRGTGYNYYNGSTWGAAPTARIENARVGWGNVADTRTQGEVVISHNGGATKLHVATRPTKGTGAWANSTTSFPSYAGGNWWPRMVTSHPAGGDTIYSISITNSGVVNGLDGCLFFSRSFDGGLTWSALTQPTGFTSANYLGFSADAYAIAAKGSTVAIVAGDSDSDVGLAKSTDGGLTWTYSTVYDFPLPLWDFTTTTSDVDNDAVADTINTNDGNFAVALDNNGNAYVAFGAYRLLNDAPSASGYSYFPYTDGLILWNEGMAALTHANEPTWNYVAAIEDLLNDNNIDFPTPSVQGDLAFGRWGCSLTSYPSMAFDNANSLYLSYSAIVDGLASITNAEKLVRHQYVVKADATCLPLGIFTAPMDIVDNSSVPYEGIFGSMAKNIDGNVHIVYQRDFYPGNGIPAQAGQTNPDADNLGNPNDIVYTKIPVGDFGPCVVSVSEGIKKSPVDVLNFYPNPASNNATIEVALTETAKLDIAILNTVGQTIYATSVNGNVGSNKVDVNLGNLSAGLYFYQVKVGNSKAITKKFAVEK
jgi:hypothetical protein